MHGVAELRDVASLQRCGLVVLEPRTLPGRRPRGRVVVGQLVGGVFPDAPERDVHDGAGGGLCGHRLHPPTLRGRHREAAVQQMRPRITRGDLVNVVPASAAYPQTWPSPAASARIAVAVDGQREHRRTRMPQRSDLRRHLYPVTNPGQDQADKIGGAGVAGRVALVTSRRRDRPEGLLRALGVIAQPTRVGALVIVDVVAVHHLPIADIGAPSEPRRPTAGLNQPSRPAPSRDRRTCVRRPAQPDGCQRSKRHARPNHSNPRHRPHADHFDLCPPIPADSRRLFPRAHRPRGRLACATPTQCTMSAGASALCSPSRRLGRN